MWDGVGGGGGEGVVFKTNVSIFRVLSFKCFLDIFRARKFGMRFLGVKFWSRIFLLIYFPGR